jgi:hypothetical protein
LRRFLHPSPAREVFVRDGVSEALRATLISPNEADRNCEAANVVDGLFYIGRALYAVAHNLEGLAAVLAGTMRPKDGD